MENLMQFIKNLWTQTIAPSLKAISDKRSREAQSIVSAIDNKAEINPDEISAPIIEAQKETTQAIKEIHIPEIEIPEVSFDSLEKRIDELKTALEKKEMVVNVDKTSVEVDTKPFVKAIESLKNSFPKMEKQEVIDYTLMLDELMKILERPQDQKEILKLQELVKKLGTTEDLAVIAAWLDAIYKKEETIYPFEFEKGRLKVMVDRVGGGGAMGLTALETGYLKKVSDVSIDYDTTEVDTTGTDIVITKKKNGAIVDTKTVKII